MKSDSKVTNILESPDYKSSLESSLSMESMESVLAFRKRASFSAWFDKMCDLATGGRRKKSILAESFEQLNDRIYQYLSDLSITFAKLSVSALLDYLIICCQHRSVAQ